MVQDQPGQKVSETTSQTTSHVMHVYNPSYEGGISKKIVLQCQLGQKYNTLSEK
jgi:hypothetical protein